MVWRLIGTTEELQRRIAQWLGVPDPSTNYHAALKKRHPETGLWFVNGRQFDDWNRSDSSLMWLHGNTGCGKTVLRNSAAALQSILEYQEEEPDTAVSFFYFDFNDVEKQSSSTAIRSLLFQFALHSSDDLQSLQQLHQRCINGQQQPAEDTIHSLLQEIMKQIKSKYIILDAIDECTDREDLLRFICDLAKSKVNGLRVMVASRRERDIEEQLRAIADYNINIQGAVVDKDIRAYVRDRLVSDPKLKKWPREVQDEICGVMMEKANGMFRWVYCQLQSIRQCVKLRALREVLSSLPRTLDETYDRILHGIESTGLLQDAIRALQWLCYASRPLKLFEIVEVLAIENGGDGGFSPGERLPDPADIMVVCSSLISCRTVDNDNDDGDDNLKNNNEVRLAHFSVKEYLLSDRCAFRSDFATRTCHQQIAEGCLRYLLYLSEQAPLNPEVVNQHPLAPYAAEHWWQHAREIDGTLGDLVLELALRLMVGEDRALLTWVQLYNIDNYLEVPKPSFSVWGLAQPLYYAASIGVSQVLQQILMDGRWQVNAQEGYHGNSLQAASRGGFEKVVQMLLDAGARVNAQGGYYDNALQAASRGGNETVVQMLLDAGAEVNAQGGRFGHALQAASHGGHVKVIQMLLDSGAQVNAQRGAYGTALQAASYVGDEMVVQILLNVGAEANIQGGRFGNALQAASFSGNANVVQQLLDKGAKINVQGGRYGNALQAASYMDNEAVVRILLDAGAEVNAQGGMYHNALEAALCNGHANVVQMLLDAGAEGGRSHDG